MALLHQIKETPRGGNEDIYPPLELPNLSVLIHPAENNGVAQGKIAAVISQALSDLGRQFPGGGEDKGPGASLPRSGSIL